MAGLVLLRHVSIVSSFTPLVAQLAQKCAENNAQSLCGGGDGDEGNR